MIYNVVASREPNTQFKDYEPNVTMEDNEYLVVKFPNGSHVFLHSGYTQEGAVSLFVYDDLPSMNQVMSYDQRNRRKPVVDSST